jgi:hypothetical protein
VQVLHKVSEHAVREHAVQVLHYVVQVLHVSLPIHACVPRLFIHSLLYTYVCVS